jgi:hypothetical protein
MNKMKLLLIFFLIIIPISVNALPFQNTPELDCEICPVNSPEGSFCDSMCGSGNDPINPPGTEPGESIDYPINFDLDHTFSSSNTGNMYMALLSPYGEVIKSDTEQIGTGSTTLKNTFDKDASYNSLDLEVFAQCDLGPGDYNLLVHTNPIFGRSTKFTAETNLYHCSSLIELLDQVRVPVSWENTNELSIYCSTVENAGSDIFNLFDFNILKEAYSGCVIKNEDTQESIIVGHKYGSEIEDGYNLIKFDSISEVQDVFGTNVVCTNEEEIYTCDVNGINYTFKYTLQKKFFEIYKETAEVTKSLNSIVSYSDRVENPNSNSLLIKKFNSTDENAKMIIGYEIPSGFFRENFISILDANTEINDFDFDSTFVVHYKNFGNIEQSCYESLRGQSSSNLESEFIKVISDQDRMLFDIEFNIICFKNFIVINSETSDFVTLYKNLVFDTVIGEIVPSTSYESIFEGRESGNTGPGNTN